MKPHLPAIGTGALVGATMWLWDLVRLSGYEFAGVSDADAASRVLEVTRGAVLTLELKLLVVHLVVGAVLGGVAQGWFRRRPTPPGLVLASAGFTLAFALAALFGMVGRYPQLFADRWWLGGGALAMLQRVITHSIGPWVFDAICVLLLLGALATPALRLVRYRPALFRRLASATGVIVFAAVALRGQTSARSSPDAPLNVLVIAADSLRTDSLENPHVMPFMASSIPEGALFRHAVTPIARTYPSWVSTLTGTEPREHDVRHMFPTTASRRDVGPTLFTELRDRGYFTFATSDFAGDVFPGFEGGFDELDTPHLNVDTLAQSTVLSRHTFSLPLLRVALFRDLFPQWRNVPSLADPEWVVDRALGHLASAGERPFAGLVFFSTAHFPYVGPYPHYKRASDGYRGRYLYHVPPVPPEHGPTEEDVHQIRARFDGALTALDAAIERLLGRLAASGLAERTLVIVTGDHGEDLYEETGIAGHGDTLRHLRSQAAPVLVLGPGVPRGLRSNAQVRLYDLPATVLDHLGFSTSFGEGVTLFDEDAERPICVETGIWFWPSRPIGLRGKRLDYPGISELLELEPSTREMVLRSDRESLVESAKERGVVLGARLYREQPTPNGIEAEIVSLPGVDPSSESVDLKELFDERCVAADPHLSRLYGTVVFERAAP